MEAIPLKDSPFAKYLEVLIDYFSIEFDALQDPKEQENDHHPDTFLHQEFSIKNNKNKVTTAIKKNHSFFASLYCTIWQFFRQMRLHAIQYSLDVFTKRLTFYMPELSNHLMGESGHSSFSSSSSSSSSGVYRWWLLHVCRDFFKLSSSPTMVSIVLVLLSLGNILSIIIPSAMWMFVFVFIPFGCIFMESFYQAFVLYYSYQLLKFIKTIRGYCLWKKNYETKYQSVLSSIKKAEIASRGYRIGTKFPPIGRIETQKQDSESEGRQPEESDLECVGIRQQLSLLNDKLEKEITCQTDVKDTRSISSHLTKGKTSKSRQIPSLLLTALEKRHEMVLLLVESHLRTNLMQVLCQCLINEKFDLTKMSSLYRQLTLFFRKWTLFLEKMNRFHHIHTKKQGVVDTKQVVGVQIPLTKEFTLFEQDMYDLVSILETCQALLFTCQHDTKAFLSTSNNTSEHQVDNLKYVNKMLTKSTQIEKMLTEMVHQYTKWSTQLKVVENQFTNSNKTIVNNSSTSEETCSEVVQEDNTLKSKLLMSKQEQEQQEQQQEEEEQQKDCTLVFSGMSTGGQEEEQSNDQASSSVARQQYEDSTKLIRELQDVLSHREIPREIQVNKEPADQEVDKSLDTSKEHVECSQHVSLHFGLDQSIQNELKSLLFLPTTNESACTLGDRSSSSSSSSSSCSKSDDEGEVDYGLNHSTTFASLPRQRRPLTTSRT